MKFEKLKKGHTIGTGLYEHIIEICFWLKRKGDESYEKSNMLIYTGIAVFIIIVHMVKNPVVSGILCEDIESFAYNGRRYSAENIYIADDELIRWIEASEISNYIE